MEHNSERLLSPTESIAYLDEKHGVQIAPKTLANLACSGDGPKFCKIGRARKYKTGWLDEYVTSRLSPPVTSTTELKALSNVA